MVEVRLTGTLPNFCIGNKLISLDTESEPSPQAPLIEYVNFLIIVTQFLFVLHSGAGMKVLCQ